MKVTVQKIIGTALLWAGLAALVFVPSSQGPQATIVAMLGFGSFASGLTLFANGLKREIVAQVRGGVS